MSRGARSQSILPVKTPLRTKRPVRPVQKGGWTGEKRSHPWGDLGSGERLLAGLTPTRGLFWLVQRVPSQIKESVRGRFPAELGKGSAMAWDQGTEAAAVRTGMRDLSVQRGGVLPNQRRIRGQVGRRRDQFCFGAVAVC